MIIAIGIVYILSFLINIGAMNAYWYGRFGSISRDEYGSNVIFAIIFSLLLPISLLTVFCITGFYEYGFRWRVK